MITQLMNLLEITMYYYEVKITFLEVDYINCPVYFDTDSRFASTEEREKYRGQCQLEKEDLMIVFDFDVSNTFYYLSSFEFEMGLHKLQLNRRMIHKTEASILFFLTLIYVPLQHSFIPVDSSSTFLF